MTSLATLSTARTESRYFHPNAPEGYPAMSLLLSPLREATPERHRKAVQGLRDGTLTVSLTRQTEAEIRALVRNGDGREYGVSLTEHGTFCSCKDALYRSATLTRGRGIPAVLRPRTHRV